MILLFDSVSEPSPAWQCGLRQGDLIVQINDWRIASMDKPEVDIRQPNTNKGVLFTIKIATDTAHMILNLT